MDQPFRNFLRFFSFSCFFLCFKVIYTLAKMKQSSSMTNMDNIVDEYISHVRPALKEQQKAFTRLTEEINKQIALKKMELESSIHGHDKIIQQLKQYSREVLRESQQCILVPGNLAKTAQNKEERILSWFKSLNELKNNNEHILKKRISQLEQKIKNLNSGKDKAEVERYKKANTQLIRVNKNLVQRIELLNKQEPSQTQSLNSRQIQNESSTNLSEKRFQSQNHIGIQVELLKQREKQFILQLSKLEDRLNKIKLKQLQEANEKKRKAEIFLQQEKDEKKKIVNDLERIKASHQKLELSIKEKDQYYQQTENSFRALKNEIHELNKALLALDEENKKLRMQNAKLEQILFSQIREKQAQNSELLSVEKENNALRQKVFQLQEQYSQHFLIIEQQRSKLMQLIEREGTIENMEQKCLALEATNTILRSQIIDNHEQNQKSERELRLQIKRLTHQ